VEALDEAVALGSAHLRGGVLDLLELQKTARRYAGRPAAELSLRMVTTRARCFSKNGNTSLLRIWTAVSGSLLVLKRPGFRGHELVG
jgi:hypothetical protein